MSNVLNECYERKGFGSQISDEVPTVFWFSSRVRRRATHFAGHGSPRVRIHWPTRK